MNSATPLIQVAGDKAPSEPSALELTLKALRPVLDDPAVTEVCINRPGEAFLETAAGWRREALPFADFAWCVRLAKLVANSTRQRVDEETPILSASLPSGERIQIVKRPRIGVDYAGHWARRLLRFYIAGNPFVSKK